MLNDASAGLIQSDADALLSGFAAYGSSVADLPGALVDTYAVNLFDDDMFCAAPRVVRRSVVGEADLGNSADDQPQARIQRQQTPVQSVPASLRLTYYDPDRDFQSGEARALASEQPGKETQVQLPAVLSADAAKSLAQDVLARAFAERDKITLRLPPRYLGLEPGSTLSVPVGPSKWRVDTAKVDGFVMVAELRPVVATGAGPISADPERVIRAPTFNLDPSPWR